MKMSKLKTCYYFEQIKRYSQPSKKASVVKSLKLLEDKP